MPEPRQTHHEPLGEAEPQAAVGTASPAPPPEPPRAPVVERWVPYVLLTMGIVLFVATLVTVWTVPTTAGVLLGGAIVSVVLSAVINNSDELEFGDGLFRSIRRRRQP
jgi:hypothetical protein